MPLTRRQFLWGVTASGLAYPMRARAQSAASRLFRHGVASGDPEHDRVILWTRVTPATGTARPLEVRWRVATDPAMARTVQSGVVQTSADRDYTVKVDARGLQPGAIYHYAFEYGGERSPIGRAKTIPAAPQRVRLAVVSCANYPAGYFTAYRLIAQRDDLDAVVHLGDYIYEFPNGEYGDGRRLNRLPQPLHEAVTLADYRQRYATYRSDQDLQEVHRLHPFIAIWDDHESANNSWRSGAQNHNPEQGEGEWAVRRAAAWRAYLEWMPLREQPDPDIRLYRRIRFGRLADLVMLDTRGLRDAQVAPNDLAGLANPARRLLGANQETWLYDTMRHSVRDGTQWRVIGQQVLLSRLVPPGQAVQFSDSWDGYQAERGRVMQYLQREQVRNVAILTGDVHSSWAFDVPPNPWNGYRPGTGAGSLAVELVTPAISSPSLFTPQQALNLTPAIRASIPSLKYLEGQRQGYLLVDVTAARLRADWFHVPTVDERILQERLAASFVCETGSARLAPA